MSEHPTHADAHAPEPEQLDYYAQRLALQKALMAETSEDIAELLPPLLEGGLMAEDLEDLLAEMAFYGQDQLAAKMANEFEQRLGEAELAKEQDLAYALEQHQVFAAIATYWQSAADAEAEQAFVEALRRADIEDPADLAALRALRDSSVATQIGQIKQSFREREIDAALMPAQLAFGRSQTGLNLFTAAAMIEQAFGLWQLAPEKGRPEFDKWFKIKPADLSNYIRELAQDAPTEAFVLLWGLPHVCDWLGSQGLLNPLTRQYLLGQLAHLRRITMDIQNEMVWTYAFAPSWPRAAGEPEEAEVPLTAFEPPATAPA